MDRRDLFLLLALLAAAVITAPSAAAQSDLSPAGRGDLRAAGYFRGTAVRMSVDLPEPAGTRSWTEYRLQNRLNLRWDPAPDLAFHWQMRTRMFAGDLLGDIPGYAGEITRDDGLVDLSWTIAEEDDWLLHYIPDRLYAELDRGDWNVRAGRQRVNWGVNRITNPNDIFNIYSIYDFDYPERPGSDALRIQRFIGFGSRIEVAASPDRDIKDSVAAALYAFAVRGYDVQAIGGWYRKRLTAGGGWAGNLGGAGLKGETMFFADTENDKEGRNTTFITAASIDYMFAGGLFLVTELLYNQEGGRSRLQVLTEPLSPDNPSFSKYQLALQANYPFHPLVDATLTAIAYPDEDAAFLSPALTWSALQNLDFQLIGQFFAAPSDSALSTAPSLFVASLKYSF